MSELTQEKLKELLSYDPESGEFTWRVSKGRVAAGSVAGTVSKNCRKGRESSTNYIVIRIDRKPYFAHRLAFLYVEGGTPRFETDHIDGDGTNNKWKNLRSVTNSQNQMNKRLNKNNKSGISGIIWRAGGNRWEARIKVRRKYICLGSTPDFFEACCWRKSAESKYGFHPNHGRKEKSGE